MPTHCEAAVAAILAAVPMILVYLVLHRQVTAALVLSGGVKG